MSRKKNEENKLLYVVDMKIIKILFENLPEFYKSQIYFTRPDVFNGQTRSSAKVHRVSIYVSGFYSPKVDILLFVSTIKCCYPPPKTLLLLKYFLEWNAVPIWSFIYPRFLSYNNWKKKQGKYVHQSEVINKEGKYTYKQRNRERGKKRKSQKY